MRTYLTVVFLGIVSLVFSQKPTIPFYFEELTSPQMAEAIQLSGKTCIIPLGILEKHGPHLPVGTDLLESRELTRRAVSTEYAVVFPQYYFGQIFEAKHQPGVIAYSNQLVWNILQETCDELARNGFEKIILVNGHGGNNSFLPYVSRSLLLKKTMLCTSLLPMKMMNTIKKLSRCEKVKAPTNMPAKRKLLPC